ncbi:MAG: hypothetical protein FVQ80_02840 [Planctomycetes bacterium]|nr:hypothetical protein [Planctomycetota bacterium]
MDAKGVIDKILSDANAQAEDIKKQAKVKTDAEKQKLDAQINKHEKQTTVLVEKAAEEKKSHILAAARMEIAKEYLAEKRKILDDIFEQAQKKLQNLPEDEYKKICTKLMVQAVESGDEEVVVDVNEKCIDHEFIKLINRELGPGFKGNLRLYDQKEDIGAGFILKRGRIKNNVSMNVLLEQLRKQLEIELANELFAN